MKTYVATGLVYGRLWGGGEGAYKARRLTADTLPALIAEAEKGLDGSLDSGMGYERLLGARLDIEEIEIIKVNGKNYEHSEFKTRYIGTLTDKQKRFLAEL